MASLGTATSGSWKLSVNNFNPSGRNPERLEIVPCTIRAFPHRGHFSVASELTSPTELAVGGSRFFRSGRLKRSETVGRRPSMPENVIATLIQPQKSTKTRPKDRRLPPFQQSCHLLGYPRAQLRRGCGSQHVQ